MQHVDARRLLAAAALFRQPGGQLAPKAGDGDLETVTAQLADLKRQHAYLLSNLPGMVYRCEPGPPWRMSFVSDKVVELTGFHPDDFAQGMT